MANTEAQTGRLQYYIEEIVTRVEEWGHNKPDVYAHSSHFEKTVYTDSGRVTATVRRSRDGKVTDGSLQFFKHRQETPDITQSFGPNFTPIDASPVRPLSRKKVRELVQMGRMLGVNTRRRPVNA